MLLSRALNRGYARSRFQWPVDFGLLNNECLWVYDELQLMGSGVSTSAQLAGLRERLTTFGPTRSVWMSATMDRSSLRTVDLRDRVDSLAELTLTESELATGDLGRRMTAKKTLRAAGITSTDKDGPKKVAELVKAKHEAGTLTLVVLNTVNRAKDVFAQVEKALKTVDSKPELLLIHSRFRPTERKILNDALQGKALPSGGRIIVATQVVEAGVDISARVLITDLAPWSSLVQRLGRCHRIGEPQWDGEIYWLDVDVDKGLPYQKDELDEAKQYLVALEGQDASPKSLEAFRFEGERVELKFEHIHVVRRRDLLDLFDTAPDLSGNDIDVSRFVRGDDPETDVYVFWRDANPKAGPDDDERAPGRNELCPVPVSQFREFLKKRQPAAFRFDHLDDAWVEVAANDVRPGLMILLPTTAGGYDWDDEAGAGSGWDGDSTAKVTARPPEDKSARPEAAGSDTNSALGKMLTIADHTKNVCAELKLLLQCLEAQVDAWSAQLTEAARWHDAGKAHIVFQKAMYGTDTPDPTRLLAKSGRKGRLDYGKYGRKHFRHELASALAALQRGLPFESAYLIASHHGRARLAIRALPGENQPDDPRTLFALGVHDGDMLPPVDSGVGNQWPETILDLTPMQMGGECSWTANALKLLGELGPFRLAYLEALLRAADVRASKKEAADA